MPHGRPTRQLHLATAALAVVAGCTVAACSSVPNPVGNGGSPTGSPSASPTSSAGTVAQPTAPLTDLPASASAAAKPAVAVDLGGANPSGLGSADVVFQEFSAPVRYVAVFQSRQADAGPVTSTQPSDEQILTVLHPLLGYDGAAAPYFITNLDKSKTIKDAGASGHPSFYTSGAQGVTASTSAIVNGISGATAPPPLFPYRGADSGASTLATAGLSRPTGVQITIPGNGTENWSFDQQADRWKLTSGGPSVEVANLVVQMVSYKTIGVNAKAGISTQSAEVTGTGKAEVLSASAAGGSGGTAASGTWSKPHLGSVTNYLDSSGTQMYFQPGSTWVILAPPGTRVATSG
jgi:hypothetical protein